MRMREKKTFPILAGVLFTLCTVGYVAYTEMLHRQGATRTALLIGFALACAFPLFAAVVSFARLRGVPALIACGLGAASRFYRLISALISGGDWSQLFAVLAFAFLFLLALPDAGGMKRTHWMRKVFFVPALSLLAYE